MDKPYLISASTFIVAKFQAIRLNLEDHEWIYVPYDEKERQRRIRNLHYTPEEAKSRLYGFFSKEEYQYLIQN
ncbi:hypothetical protein [Desmospora profundinema]|uniref:Uncharacterized protein n=1 Tax=Desmospora profundinema TaxID=1571184 RepID=A0ABU1IRH5_9BACL|nr:hypothetical protein [Desmospora profundinema]MDR6226345.1 hypothetical protein [Desmospora profundinema]